MVPRSALPDIFKTHDPGFCTIYAFDEVARAAVKAQGDATGLSRFPVYADRLWLDIDVQNDTPEEREAVRLRAREITKELQAEDLHITVWESGSKGYHIGIRTTPMFGKDVPWSHREYVLSRGWKCDMSLYQHGRLFRNPNAIHKKTGRRKSKVFEYAGTKLLDIQMVPAPVSDTIDRDTLTSVDLARIGLSRLSGIVQSTPLPGMRHTSLWSCATQLLEAGLDLSTVSGLMKWANRTFPEPKTEDEVERAVNQAASQLGLK